ncbi:MAG: DUF6603 domain-containing protein, partial [Chitinophagaceae bacterium]
LMAETTPFSLLVTGKTRIGNPGLWFTISIGTRISNTETRVYASLEAAGANSNGIGLPELIRFFKPDFDTATMPGLLNSLPRFKSFRISYGTGNQSSQFILEVDTQLDINGKKLDITLTYDSQSGKGDKSTAFGGTLRLGEHVFDLRFLRTTINNEETSYLFAQYSYKAGAALNLKDIAGKLLTGAVAGQVPNISIDISGLTAFLLYSKTGANSNILFGMGAGVDFSLDNLPLVGEVMEKEKSFGLKQVLLTLSWGSFTEAQLQALNKTLPKPVMPTAAVLPGNHFGISTLMKLGDTEEYYSLIPEPAAPAPPPNPPVPAAPNYTPVPGSVSGKAKWIKVGKQIGPVDFQRIGIGYIDKRLVFLLDANLAVSLLSIQLKGLGLGFELKWPVKMPSFYIDGLGLSFKKDPIEISGLLVRVDPKAGEQFSFYGAARISTSKFSITGIGAYSKLVNNQISFFIYAMYNGPIGGPAFFFVTGIAAGFGYNRRIRVPAIDQVRDFPLVAMALNPDPNKTLENIVTDLIDHDWIPSSPGDYWLAIGIRFSSFKLIDSFVLVTVQFGTRVEFALLGLSVLKWPAIGTAIAYVELAILVRFGQGSDVIAVDAMITRNSYILDTNCRLTGGFAFYVWISGPHAGDFVITLGGYHPRFKVPAHYPRVDRLALTWKLSSLVSIHGEMYYALTSTAIMAGGRWEVEYNLSFLRASLTLWADMIISWAPFFYEINAGIRVRIEARIRIAFVRIYFSLEMGAELHIWGPPFAGEVYVDWTIFSFTIPFGAGGRRVPPPLDWKEFTSSFLPNKKQSAGAEPEPIETRVTGGVIRQYKNKTGKTITMVNPYELILTTETLIPVKEFRTKKDNTGFSAIGDQTLMETDEGNVFTTFSQRNKDMGIKSMDIRILDSHLDTWVEKKAGDNSWKVQPMNVLCTAKGVADALWGPEKNNIAGPPPEAKIIRGAMTGVQFHPNEPAKGNAFTEKKLGKDFTYFKINAGKVNLFPVNTDALNNDKSTIKETIRVSLNNRETMEVADTLQALGFGLYTKEEMGMRPLDSSAGIDWLEIPFLAKPGSNIPVP